jgi:hypothetical protein
VYSSAARKCLTHTHTHTIAVSSWMEQQLKATSSPATLPVVGQPQSGGQHFVLEMNTALSVPNTKHVPIRESCCTAVTRTEPEHLQWSYDNRQPNQRQQTVTAITTGIIAKTDCSIHCDKTHKRSQLTYSTPRIFEMLKSPNLRLPNSLSRKA